jgi:hypothetical protein
MTLVGTWDEARFPNVAVGFHRSPLLNDTVLTDEIMALDIGDSLLLSSLPTFLQYDDVSQLVQGCVEVLGKHTWDVGFNCTPAGPYQSVPVLGHTDYVPRLDASTHALTTAMTTTDTSAWLGTPLTGQRWVDSATHPSEFPFDIKVSGELMSVTAIATGVSDAFGRTSASSFGSADLGGAYTTVNGSASDYNVSTGLGRITGSTTGTTRLAVLAAQQFTDVDVTATVSVSAVALTQSLLPMLVARYTDTSNYYRAEVTFNTGSTVDGRLRVVVGGVTTSLQFLSLSIPYSAGVQVKCRFQVSGTTLRMKLWLASAVEPSGWQLSSTESVLTTGSIGVGYVVNVGNTNVNPEARFDDLLLNTPQLATVTRSENAVVKAQTAGTPIRLAQPFYLAR